VAVHAKVDTLLARLRTQMSIGTRQRRMSGLSSRWIPRHSGRSHNTVPMERNVSQTFPASGGLGET
jgi:hypothetical protein